MLRQWSILPFLYFIIILIMIIICFVFIKAILYVRLMKTIYGIWQFCGVSYNIFLGQQQNKSRTKRNANEFVHNKMNPLSCHSIFVSINEMKFGKKEATLRIYIVEYTYINIYAYISILARFPSE